MTLCHVAVEYGLPAVRLAAKPYSEQMYTATLLTAPDRPSLTAGGVEALLARWQGHGLRWLAPG